MGLGNVGEIVGYWVEGALEGEMGSDVGLRVGVDMEGANVGEEVVGDKVGERVGMNDGALLVGELERTEQRKDCPRSDEKGASTK